MTGSSFTTSGMGSKSFCFLAPPFQFGCSHFESGVICEVRAFPGGVELDVSAALEVFEAEFVFALFEHDAFLLDVAGGMDAIIGDDFLAVDEDASAVIAGEEETVRAFLRPH
jgi:hypothetical protein